MQGASGTIGPAGEPGGQGATGPAGLTGSVGEFGIQQLFQFLVQLLVDKQHNRNMWENLLVLRLVHTGRGALHCCY